MKIKGLSVLSGLAMFGTALMSNVSPVSAAALTGDVLISPFPPPAGVRLIGTGINAPNGNPLTQFNFVPPLSFPDQGGLIELGANPDPGSEFVQYIGQLGLIKDLTLADFNTLSAGGTVDFIIFNKNNAQPNDFVVDADTAFTFALQNIGAPVYTITRDRFGNPTGTSVSLGFRGFFTHYGDGSGDISQGQSSVSIDFAGLSPTQVRELFDEAGETPNRTFNWSANIVASVPESSNLLGLLAFGLMGSGLIIKQQKPKI